VAKFTESVVEDAALAWLGELGFALLHGPEIAPGELAAERTSLGEGLLPKRLRAALRKLNPTLPTEALDEALRKLKDKSGGFFTCPQPGGEVGDRRVGVVWHTQGSGKSLTMAFYAGRLVLEPAMENPTLVMLTDRNDLDDQLFGTFSRCHELLRQKPVQANSREHLRELLKVASGGVIFTTIHKFFPDEKGGKHPPLSDRRNILVIADEAHRSQYDFIDGFARHMRDALPHASFIGFTGTPLEKSDANTRPVFGDYISIYDIQRAVEDKATVPIYYEGRLAKLELRPEERPKIDPDFEEATEGRNLTTRKSSRPSGRHWRRSSARKSGSAWLPRIS